MAAGSTPRQPAKEQSRPRDSFAARLTSLRGILALEQSRGFDNSAVAGGLDRFIEDSREFVPWLSDLFEAGDRSYAGLNKAQRRAWAARATARASRAGQNSRTQAPRQVATPRPSPGCSAKAPQLPSTRLLPGCRSSTGAPSPG